MPSQLELELLLLTGSESSYLLFIKNVNFHKLSRKCEHYYVIRHIAAAVL